MRLASMMLLAIILSWFSIQAQVNIFGLNMTMPEPLISEPNMGVPEPLVSKPNMDMPEPLMPKPNMDMPEPKPKPPMVSDKNSDQTINLNDKISSSKTQMTQMEKDANLMNVSGKWLIKLNKSTGSSLDLNLWSSSGTKIMGFGTLTEGSTKNSVSATGSIGAQELTLTTKSAVPDYDREYNLHLFMVNNTLSGTYVLKSGGQYLGEGNATAVRQ
jgi:hypothetical protein